MQRAVLKKSMLTILLSVLGGHGADGLAMANAPIGPPALASAHSPKSIESVPEALRPAFLESLANDGVAGKRIDEHGCAMLTAQSLKGCFDERGAHFSSPGTTALTLRLDTVGRGSRQTSVKSAKPVIADNRVTYTHESITEWWRALPVGFEQGFTVAKRPSGEGNLTLALASSETSDLRDGTLAWDKFRYGGLVVTDATGKVVPSTLKNERKGVVLAIDDAQAEFPLSIDPVLWTEQRVTSSDNAVLQLFGWAVAMDAAGTTALISGPFWNDVDPSQPTPVPAPPGAVYVFANTGGVWTQTQKIQPSDSSPGDNFGYALAISGTTAVITSFPEDAYANFPGGNAVYVFTASGGTWTQQQKLVPSDNPPGSASFGYVVAVDGSTIVAGAPGTNGANVAQGAAYIFSLQNGTWTQTQELTQAAGATYDYFGYGVAVHGNVVVVGSGEAAGSKKQVGAAYVYAPSAGTWEQVQKLTPPDGTVYAAFGSAFALDDTTMLVGANYQVVNGINSGAVYVFTQSDGVWTETQELGPSDGQGFGFFGISVALSDGRALIGARQSNAIGKAYLFTSAAGVWTQDQELSASDGVAGDEFGATVALGGNSALVGAPTAGPAWNGVSYFYIEPPPIADILPASLSFAFTTGGSGSGSLSIGNDGGQDLTWAIAEAPANASSGSVVLRGTASRAYESPMALSSSLSFVLDNGSYQEAFGFPSQSIYLNRFSPPAGTGSFTIDSISVMWPQQWNGSASLVGQQVNLVAYYDADGDGDPSNAVRLGGDQVTTIASLDSFVEYTVNFLVPGDGDIYVGFEFTPPQTGYPWTLPVPAQEGNPQDGANSWAISNSGSPVDMNNLGNNTFHNNLKAVGLTKTPLIRATGAVGGCSSPSDISWLSETPANGSVAGGASQDVTLTFDTTGLDPGTYSATLCVTSNDLVNSLIQIPVALTVLAPGDRVFDSGFDEP